MEKERFKNSFAANVFRFKYSQGPSDTWDALADRLVEDVCGTRWGTQPKLMSDDERKQLAEYIKEMKFIPGGRYLYYAGRQFKAYNNCYLLRGEEDTREEWSSLFQRASSCLLTGGGIGIDYSIFRPSGKALTRTGGKASGPLPLMYAINEIGRNVMQGGSRRSAIYASLDYRHEDIPLFLRAKNWRHFPVGTTGINLAEVKEQDFNFPAPLDMTNISINYDDSLCGQYFWKEVGIGDGKQYTKLSVAENLMNSSVYLENVKQAMMTGEPGFSFNFNGKERETLRNACTEVTSEDDSDVLSYSTIH